MEANTIAKLKQTSQQAPLQKPSISEANHNTIITTSFLVAARKEALFFVIADTPEWEMHQQYRKENAMLPLLPTTIIRDGIAYRGARVPYPTPPGYQGAVEPAPAKDEAT
jgi:hypothetical protein